MVMACLMLLFGLALLCMHGQALAAAAAELTRADFPPDFVFGAGTSAYQAEGAVAEDGRSPSIWDSYTHAGGMPDKSNGDVAADGYHKYKDDVKLMADTGLEAYKLSISWSRLIPNGRGAVNPKGLEYYNNLINELLKYGIETHVTIYHLDLPQVLEDEYGGWLSPKIVHDFTAFADVCFSEFGDRVTHWTTVAEPNVIGMASYDTGLWPPCRCSDPFGTSPFGVSKCTAGNSSTEPYIVVHNLLLAHASVVNLYRKKYKAAQNGLVGINVYTFWCYPFSNSTADSEAAQRTLDFNVGWIADPLVRGDYPAVMKKNAGSRIPSFTKLQSEQIRGAFDFIGINHYASLYTKDDSDRQDTGPRDYNKDVFVKLAVSKNASQTGQFDPNNIRPDPAGLQHLLEYLADTYGKIPIYVQENGYRMAYNETLNDTRRIDYLSGFMRSTLNAMRNGVNARGYFVWSFMDVFELVTGYKITFGLYHVNFEDEQRSRQPKFSAQWYSDFLRNNGTIKEMNALIAESLADQ